MTTPATIKKLHNMAGGECSFPGCSHREDLHEAHIVGQKRSAARGREPLPAGVGLNDYENLILFCPNHHYQVDGDKRGDYPVERLHAMKAAHESDVVGRLATTRNEIAGIIETRATDADELTGVRITKPTRIAPGTQIKTEANRVKKVTGLEIGGEIDV